MIFKLQQSIVSSDGKQSVLSYNRDRSVMGEMPMTRPIRKLFRDNGDPLKLYVEGDVDEQGVIHIDDVVEDQSW